MKRLLLTGVVATLALAGTGWYCYPRSEPNELRLPGTVETQEVRLGSKVGGRVACVNIREGQHVEAGQELIRFEGNEWAARRDQAQHRWEALRSAWEKSRAGPLAEEIAEAKAALDAAQARLTRMKAGSRNAQKRQAQAEVEAEAANLRKAEDDLARIGKLTAFSETERGAVQSKRDHAHARLKSAKATLDLIQQGNREEDIAEAEAERTRFEARYQFIRRGVRDEDKSAAYAAVAEAEAAVRLAEEQLREVAVIAPERCVIEVLSVRVGDLVPAGQAVVRAHRADDLWVKVFVPSTELGKLKLGQSVEVAIDSHPGRRFPGEVSQIATVSEFTPRNVQSLDERRHQVFAVKVRVANPEGVFKSGMAAEVFLKLSEGN